MSYFAMLPSLLCGILLAIEDLRTRRVPRIWVAFGMVTQCAAFIIYGASHGRPWGFLAALSYAVAAALLQWLLSSLRPGSLGFGDVTCAALVGQAVGWLGLMAFLSWWLLMGVVGLLWIGGWHVRSRFSHAPAPIRAPFVPVIVISGVCAALLPGILIF
ncbi:prepilin peptidase [Bifidobacterium subtile]|jgi:leader peptidase (prepilin peptidase)/N-methyltransferase|uniref:Peptidase A24 n=1 Tax=Bifidobacterium subtile TaxID=77635 RepID=A0A087E5D6_9BIFI|nr:prepilin peptidase [Bifidobacterium subtile]KFJ02987.1 peptidase A24 [Bifidobacterium subtile]MCI1223090.1 prepilin peptidase [Bifidobacterium subtile]MCI1241496.1 prepilin peptidase [Bifidobacterium subtile]QOL35568.1 prepilin peptidase [Bifidobacterium subtile]